MIWEVVLIKTKSLVLYAFIMVLVACGEEHVDKLTYSRSYSYGSTYALQFVGKSDDITVAFDGKGEEITVKGLRYKYLIRFSDVESISYKEMENGGVLVIQTSEKINEVGVIDKFNFDLFADEVKSRAFNLKLN